jgi:hypothetical protein
MSDVLLEAPSAVVEEAGNDPVTQEWSSRLAPLYSPDEFGGVPFNDRLIGILENVCQFGEYDFSLPPIPARPEIYKEFGIVRVKKPHQVGKDKSIRGFIWVDVDPVAILLNKYIIRSCHTLNCMEHNLRAGNFNWIYCPWMANVFAGPIHPIEAEPIIAKSRITIEPQTVEIDGKLLRIRDHQAVANLFLVRDKNQNPYLFLGRLYDSAEREFPWAKSILKYLSIRCERVGLGLAVGEKWDEYRVNRERREEVSGERIMLFTPPFDLPFRLAPDMPPQPLNFYGDDSLHMGRTTEKSEGFAFSISVKGKVVVQPNKETLGDRSTYPSVVARKSEPVNTIMPGRRKTCCICGINVGRGATPHETAGGPGSRGSVVFCCDPCAERRRITCGDCEQPIEAWDWHRPRPMRVEGRSSGEICRGCFETRYGNCHECGEYFQVDPPRRLEGDTIPICPACEIRFKVKCDDCGVEWSDRNLSLNLARRKVHRLPAECYCAPCGERRRNEQRTHQDAGTSGGTGEHSAEHDGSDIDPFPYPGGVSSSVTTTADFSELRDLVEQVNDLLAAAS